MSDGAAALGSCLAAAARSRGHSPTSHSTDLRHGYEGAARVLHDRAAVRLCGCAAVRRCGCAAVRLGGWAAVRLGSWAAGRLCGCAAGRPGGRAAVGLCGCAAVRLCGCAAVWGWAAVRLWGWAAGRPSGWARRLLIWRGGAELDLAVDFLEQHRVIERQVQHQLAPRRALRPRLQQRIE